MFNELETPSRELTEWEDKFIESVKESFEKYGNLTDKQFDVLDRIYSEKTS